MRARACLLLSTVFSPHQLGVNAGWFIWGVQRTDCDSHCALLAAAHRVSHCHHQIWNVSQNGYLSAAEVETMTADFSGLIAEGACVGCVLSDLNTAFSPCNRSG